MFSSVNTDALIFLNQIENHRIKLRALTKLENWSKNSSPRASAASSLNSNQKNLAIPNYGFNICSL